MSHYIVDIDLGTTHTVVAYAPRKGARGGVPEDIPSVELKLADGAPLGIGALLKQAGLVASTSEASRLIEQGGIRVNSETISDKALKLPAGEYVVQVGKRKFAKVTLF